MEAEVSLSPPLPQMETTPQQKRSRRDRRSSEDSTEVDALLIGMGRGRRHHKIKDQSGSPMLSTPQRNAVIKYGTSGAAVVGNARLARGASLSGRDMSGDAAGEAMLFMLEEQQQYPPPRKFHVSDKIWVSAIANLSTAVCSFRF